MSFVVLPKNIEDAVRFLADNPEARPLSGGASLVAMKNAGLIEASHFVSLARIEGLNGISVDEGGLRIGGMTRHRDIAASAHLTGDLAMIAQAAGQIANRVVRNMGTIGGAVGNADPAADYLPVLTCADADVEIYGADGPRRVSIEDYLIDWYETALEPGEIVTAIHLPHPKEARSNYHKLARTPGDYATASVACAIDGARVRVAVGACGPKPIRSAEAEAALEGQIADPAAIRIFADSLAALADPMDDVRGSSDYRLRLIPRMVTAAINEIRGAH